MRLTITRYSSRWPLAASRPPPFVRHLGGVARSRRPAFTTATTTPSAHDRHRAHSALDRLGDSPEVALLPRLCGAAPRAARRHRSRRPSASARLRAARRAAPGVDKRFAAEAWVLVAACAQIGGDDAAASRRSRMRASATTTTRGSRSSKRGRSSGRPARIAAQRDAVCGEARGRRRGVRRRGRRRSTIPIGVTPRR